VLSFDDLAFKSPGDGLPPYEVDRVIGRTLRHPVAEETALTFELLDGLVPELEGALSRSLDER
jgi:sialic acid synthase SpsE